MMSKLTAALLLLIGLAILVQAQEQSSAPTRTNGPTTGTISGKVVSESGQPMAGVTAYVRPVNSAAGGRTTATDAEGNFRMNNLSPGLYMVGANAPAYTSAPPDPNDAATYYRIGDSVNVQLVRGGVITGSVTNAAGEPVIAVRVRATMIRNAKGQTSRLPLGGMEQPTDDRGIYRIYGLAPGMYLVSAGGFGNRQAFNFNPYDFDVPTYAPSATRDNAAEVSVRGGEEANVDIRYRGESGHTVSGTVKTNGASGASIWLTPAGGSFNPGGNAFQVPGARGFAFNGVGDGEYDLIAQESITSPGSTTFILWVSEPKRVSVKGASVTGIELVTKPLASLSGKILLETSKAPECQGKRAPLFAEMLVQLRRPEKDLEKDSSSPYQRMFGGPASPDQNGAFSFRNLTVGRYQFEPRFYARYWYLQSIALTTPPAATTAKSQPATSKTDAAANWTNVKFGDQLTNLTITLAQGAASVRGKLTVAEPPAGMVLYLVPSESDKADDVLRFFVTDIAADGTFALNNLPPGKYWTLTQTTADAQTATLAKLRLPEAAAARSKLRKTAEAQKTEIELKPCQNLTDYQLK